MGGRIDIHKAGGVIIRNRHFLVTRSKGSDIFIAPGGKLENDETPMQALMREILEEIDVETNVGMLDYLGTFFADAAGKIGVHLRMDVYLINDLTSEPTPSSEIEEIRWINTQTTGIKLGSIFEHDVMPLLKANDLID
ncbi:MAG: hypothetical protein JWP06_368 [Candidatus Saccharibacteria bacterium]|nr:hypothetical protein [Candidatus Saccharibacteria bacterium]